MRVVIPLYRSPLLILVSSGDTPGTSPRRLKFWDCRSKAVVHETAFQSTITSCVVNKSTLAVQTIDGVISVYELSTMRLLTNLPSHGQGVVALSNETVSLLAYCSASAPGASTGSAGTGGSVGVVTIFDCRQLRLASRVAAHRTAVTHIALNDAGTQMATASVRGSLVRVFNIPAGVCIHVFRHGLPPLTPMQVLSAFQSTFSFSGSGQSGVGSNATSSGGGTSAEVLLQDRNISNLSFCPKGEFLLCASSYHRSSGAGSGNANGGGSGENLAQGRKGYVNVFHLGSPCAVSALDRQSGEGIDIRDEGGGGDEEGEGEGEDVDGDAWDADADDFCKVDGADAVAGAAAELAELEAQEQWRRRQKQLEKQRLQAQSGDAGGETGDPQQGQGQGQGQGVLGGMMSDEAWAAITKTTSVAATHLQYHAMSLSKQVFSAAASAAGAAARHVGATVDGTGELAGLLGGTSGVSKPVLHVRIWGLGQQVAVAGAGVSGGVSCSAADGSTGGGGRGADRLSASERGRGLSLGGGGGGCEETAADRLGAPTTGSGATSSPLFYACLCYCDDVNLNADNGYQQSESAAEANGDGALGCPPPTSGALCLAVVHAAGGILKR
jgi:hypothetical protein